MKQCMINRLEDEMNDLSGEYRNVYFSQINEKKERIYIVSYNAKKILTYDLKGIFLENECIPRRNEPVMDTFFVTGSSLTEGDWVCVSISYWYSYVSFS